MRTLHKFRLLFLASILLIVPAVHAQAAPMSQGRAAFLLAQRLGFGLQSNQVLSDLEAIRLLMENNISPFGGWDLEQPLFENDLARMLVQALGLESEIPQEERGNPQTAAYKDLLVREFGLEITGTEIPAESLSLQPVAQSLQASAGSAVSSDPLQSAPPASGSDITGSTPLSVGFLPVSEADLQSALSAVTPSPGTGAAGRPSGDVQDTTPSQP